MIPNQKIHNPVDASALGNLNLRQTELPVPRIGYAYTQGEIQGEPAKTYTIRHAEADYYEPEGSEDNTADYELGYGENIYGSPTYNITLEIQRVYDFIIAGWPMSLLVDDNLEAYWLFDFYGDGSPSLVYSWSTLDMSYGGTNYEAKIDPSSFNGVSVARSYSGLERIQVLEDLTITVPDEDDVYASADFVGLQVVVQCVMETDTESEEIRVFRFNVKAAKKVYQTLFLTLEDELIPHLEELYPKTGLVHNIWSSDGDSQIGMCFPIPFGTAYIPVSSVFITDQRYYVLGELIESVTYAITEVQSPRQWPKSVWPSTEYAFTQSTFAPYKVFQAIIADSDGDGSADANGIFPQGSKFLPISVKYTRSDTETTTDLPTIITSLLFDGVDVTIDTTGYLLSMTFKGAFADHKTRGEWLSMLLLMGHAALRIKDNGDRELVSLSKTSLLTVDGFSIVERSLSYESVANKNPYDGGHIQFPKAGDVQDVLYKYKVGLGSSASDNPAKTSLDLRFIDDTEDAQRMGTLYFERTVGKEGAVSFQGRAELLCLNPEDVITLDGSKYEASTPYDLVISHVHYQDNGLVRVKCDKLDHALSDYADLAPAALNIVEDTSSGTWNNVVIGPDGSVDEDLSGGGLQVIWDNIAGINKPDDYADVTADNPQPYSWITGEKPPADADNTEDALNAATEKTALSLTDLMALIDSDDVYTLKNAQLSSLLAFIGTNALLDKTLADGEAVGLIDKMTVDANSTGFGAAMYVAADGNLEEADAGAASTLRCMGLALETGTGAGKKILRWGRIKNTAWSWTVGGLIFVSTTTGALTQTAPSGSGEFVQVVGEAEAADTIMFAPSYDAIELS